MSTECVDFIHEEILSVIYYTNPDINAWNKNSYHVLSFH